MIRLLVLGLLFAEMFPHLDLRKTGSKTLKDELAHPAAYEHQSADPEEEELDEDDEDQNEKLVFLRGRGGLLVVFFSLMAVREI